MEGITPVRSFVKNTEGNKTGDIVVDGNISAAVVDGEPKDPLIQVCYSFGDVNCTVCKERVNCKFFNRR